MNELIPDILICLTNLKHYAQHKTGCILYTNKYQQCNCGANNTIINTNSLIEKLKKPASPKPKT